MNIEQLKHFLFCKWSKQTCSPGLRNDWFDNNPSLGQCAITSVIVNDFFGGKIMRCMTSSGSHYYNIIDGKIVDLTVEQFLGEIPEYELGEERTREYLLSNEDTKNRYLILLNSLRKSMYKLIGIDGNVYWSFYPGLLGGNRRLKIYGRLDCPSAKRWIEKGYYVKDRVFFIDEETAICAGYRPCAKCMPDKYKLWKNGQLKEDESQFSLSLRPGQR